MFASPKRATLLSWLLHCGAILLILAGTGAKTPIGPLIHDVLVTPSDLIAYRPSPHSGGGGGGGGAHADSPASQGAAPQFARFQLAVPTVEILNEHPILPMVPTLIGEADVQPANFDYKQYGDPNGVLGKLSGGPGTGGGIGAGAGTGVGPGKGPGLGPGEGGGEGGAVDFRGFGKGSITAPILVAKYEPEYSEEARRARLQGTVLLRIEVDTEGHARNITVSRSLGLGLDDRAVEAVKTWKFTAGKVNGKPAAMVAYVEVNFRLL